MKWLGSFAFVAFLVWNAHAQGPLNDGPGIGGPTASMWMHRRPYPQMFERFLPLEIKQQISGIFSNQDLSWEEKRKQMNDILDTIPPEELAKMPLPAAFEKLPTGVYDQIKLIHEDKTLKWSERRLKIRTIMRTLPHDQRRAVFKDMWFPPMPPPGFEAALSPTIYQQLVSVHQNTQLSVPEKKQKVDQIMQKAPADQLAKLPLPPLMRKLSTVNQQKIRLIMHDYNTPWEERHKKVREFVRNLPLDERKLMRPPLPPFVKQLPANIQARLEAIHDNDDLSVRERFRSFREIIDSLPDDIRATIRPQPNGPRMA
ncbi:hypothetical protein M3Y97_00181700 [Aphelenchoides bicaudatus]|nr:hypothetical protein M3Y97_00181700 [Aphelenchoides bicaudatus]